VSPPSALSLIGGQFKRLTFPS